MMEVVTLFPILHRGGEQILLKCANVKTFNNAIKKIPGARWSHTYKSWYLPLSRQSNQLIHQALQQVAILETKELRKYLLKKKAIARADVPEHLEQVESQGEKSNVIPAPEPKIPEPSIAYRLSFDNIKSLGDTVRVLTLKAYSSSTIRTYKGELMVFFQVLGKISALSLTTEDVKRYLLKCLKEGLKENTLHSRINALKFFYEQVLGKEKFFLDIPRPKKAQQLPNVLGENEIMRLFNAVANKKHKAILFMAYSAGLRVSEVINMKLKHIDSDRMQLFVQRSKGKKDRYVNLSPVLLDVLRRYIQGCMPKPTVYVFEGTAPGSIYSVRSAQNIFHRARIVAGIRKDVTFHSLRHSFATHILEKGIDIRYIKDILGHFNIKTTERYLHVRRDQLINVVSPLDDIWKKGGIEW